MNDEISTHTSSFRDPAGFIFEHNRNIYRQINFAGKADFEFFMASGLYEELADEGLLLKHSEAVLEGFELSNSSFKIIKPQRLPFVSYPYEWSFSQLKDAAHLTLRIQKIALAKGMILKDASAYNVQFIGNRPVFIDTLSFRIYKPGMAWDGYKQFCQHFIAPLALASYDSPELIKTLSVYLDGIPLALAARLLPARARTRWGLLAHILLHAASQKRYDTANLSGKETQRSITPTAMEGLINSLQRSVLSLNLPRQRTEWGQYYDNTNYSSKAFGAKKKAVSQLFGEVSPAPKLVWDLGANDGTFSEHAAAIGAYTVAFDIDYQAVESNYRKDRDKNLSKLILPLSQDFSNPSPALGWAHKERASLEQRGPADAVIALALIHHLAIGNSTPLPDVASFFKSIAKNLIIEFVPKEDTKVQILLRNRNNKFEQYDKVNFEQAFEKHFKLIKRLAITDSHRAIYLYKAKT